MTATLKRDFHIFLSVETFRRTIHALVALTLLYIRLSWDPLGHLLFNNKLTFRKGVLISSETRLPSFHTVWKESFNCYLSQRAKHLKGTGSVFECNMLLSGASPESANKSLHTNICTHLCICMCSHLFILLPHSLAPWNIKSDKYSNKTVLWASTKTRLRWTPQMT